MKPSATSNSTSKVSIVLITKPSEEKVSPTSKDVLGNSSTSIEDKIPNSGSVILITEALATPLI